MTCIYTNIKINIRNKTYNYMCFSMNNTIQRNFLRNTSAKADRPVKISASRNRKKNSATAAKSSHSRQLFQLAAAD